MFCLSSAKLNVEAQAEAKLLRIARLFVAKAQEHKLPAGLCAESFTFWHLAIMSI